MYKKGTLFIVSHLQGHTSRMDFLASPDHRNLCAKSVKLCNKYCVMNKILELDQTSDVKLRLPYDLIMVTM